MFFQHAESNAEKAKKAFSLEDAFFACSRIGQRGDRQPTRGGKERLTLMHLFPAFAACLAGEGLRQGIKPRLWGTGKVEDNQDAEESADSALI